MTDAVQPGAFTAQPTCRLRQRPRITGPRVCSLEITHACRLRKKLACDTHRLIINVWGVGLKLLD
jgi:hypothetical protein